MAGISHLAQPVKRHTEMIWRRRIECFVLLIAACAGSLAPVVCRADLEVIALYNDASPDGNGHLATFTQPALSDNGDVAFLSLLLGTANDELDNIALYRGNAAGLSVVARKGITTLDGELIMDFVNNSPSINSAGVISHSADRPGARRSSSPFSATADHSTNTWR